MTAVRDLMNTNLTQLDADTTVVEAARCMRDEDIGDVLVTEQGQLRGIVTDRDLVVRCLAEKGTGDLGDITVGELCSTNLITVSPNDDVDDAVKLMSENAVRRLPVVDGQQPVGIVSLGDLAVAKDRESALGQISATPPNE